MEAPLYTASKPVETGIQPKLPRPPNPLEANKLRSILNYGKNVYNLPYFIKKKGAQLVAKSNNHLHIIVCEIAYYLSCAFCRPLLQGKPKTFTYPKQWLLAKTFLLPTIVHRCTMLSWEVQQASIGARPTSQAQSELSHSVMSRGNARTSSKVCCVFCLLPDFTT